MHCFAPIFKKMMPLASAFLPQAFAVAAFVLAARWLPSGELAAWSMFLALASFVEMARLGMVQSAMVHFSARFPKTESGRIGRAALIFSILVGFFGAIALGLVAFFLNFFWKLDGLGALLAVFPVVALASAPLRWLDSVRLAAQDFRGLAISAAIFGAVYLGLIVAGAVFFGKSSPLQLLAWQAPAALLAYFFSPKTTPRGIFLKKIGGFRDRFWIRKFWNYGRFGLGSNLFSMLFQRADVLLLAGLVAPHGLAAYHVAGRIVTWLDFPLNAFSQAALPKIAAEHAKNGLHAATKIAQKTAFRLVLVSLPVTIGAFAAAEVLVATLGGGNYPEAVVLLRILLVAAIAKPFGRMLGALLDATGRPSANFAMIGLSLVVNLFLVAVLAQKFGATGAALASTLGVFLTTAAGQVFFRKMLKPAFQTQKQLIFSPN